MGDPGISWDQHRSDLFNYFRRCGAPRDAADDLAQATLVVLLEEPARYQPGRGPLRIYLFGIARNLRRAWERSRSRLPPADPAAPPMGGGSAAEDIATVRAAVLALVEEQREAIILREFHGLDYREIASVQEVPIGTVRSRLARAREELRKTLAGPHLPLRRREP